MILDDFGKIDIFGPFFGRGGDVFVVTQDFGEDFFLGPVTFLKMQISKKKVFRPEFGSLSKCEIGFVIFCRKTNELDVLQKKHFSKLRFFFVQFSNAP